MASEDGTGTRPADYRIAVMPTVTVAGQSIHYESDGHEGPTTIFVHGFRNSSTSWAPVRARLDNSRLHAWYLDLPGCGRSSTPPTWEECTIEAYAAAVHGFCTSLGLTDAVLVGHSLGGGIALTVALRHPELLRGLILVAPTPAEGLVYLREEQLQALIHPSDEELTALARAAFHRIPGDTEFERLLGTVRAARIEHVEGAIRSQREFSVVDRLGDIETPTLVVGGDRDGHIPIRYTLRTAAAIRRCRVQIYHNVGHAPFVEVPDDFAALLERFVLTELPLRTLEQAGKLR